MTERKTRGASRGFFYTLSPVWGRRGGNPFASSMKKPGPLGTGFWKAKSWGTVLKQAVQLCVNAGNDVSEVLRIFREAVVVDINDEELTLVVAFDPLLVALIQALEVVEADGVLVRTAALLNLLDQGRHGSIQVDQQIGGTDEFLHEVKKAHVRVKVPGGHQPHVMQVGGEDG